MVQREKVVSAEAARRQVDTVGHWHGGDLAASSSFVVLCLCHFIYFTFTSIFSTMPLPHSLPPHPSSSYPSPSHLLFSITHLLVIISAPLSLHFIFKKLLLFTL